MVGSIAFHLPAFNDKRRSIYVQRLEEHMHRRKVICAVAVATLCCAASPALAQQSTSATYDDWVVRCVTQAGPPPQKVCEMEQLTQVQGKNTPLSRVAIARPMKAPPIKLVIQLPVNVWL